MENIKDYSNHFVVKPTKIIYFFREECSAVTDLKSFLSKEDGIKGVFLKKIPENNFIETLGIEKGSTVIVFDDFHVQALSSEPLRDTLLNLSSVWNHHYQIITFYVAQQYDIFLKSSKLNGLLLNSTHLVLWRSNHDFKSIKRKLDKYYVKLKGGLTLWKIFERYVQSDQFKFLLICVSPLCRRPSVFMNTLMSSDDPVLSFHQSDSETEGEEEAVTS